MTKQEYRREREKASRKARIEFMEFVRTDGKPAEHVRQTMRAINYIVTRIGIDSVITDQLGSIMLGHMTCFARAEVSRAERDKAKTNAGKSNLCGPGRCQRLIDARSGK